MKLQDRVILHCDANNFFASVETISKPELKNKPVAVSGNVQKRTGIILAKNELAKKYGVKTGDAIWQAKEKCPDLICLPPHHDLYEVYSEKLKKIYYDYTDQVEPFGIDECWLDVSGSLRLFKSGDEIAEQIKERVKKELNLTVSIGVSFCKAFAKLGSDYKKPDAITKISRKNFKEIVYPLPISAIVGIGRRIELQLKKMNVFTLGDYVKMPTKLLEKKFGVVGVELKEKLEGFDTDEVVKNQPLPKSVGNGTTTIVDIKTKDEVETTIFFLSEKIAKRLREKFLLAKGVDIWVKTSNFTTFSKEKKIDFPTNSATEIAGHALKILCEFWNFSQTIRAIRVRTFALIGEKEFVQMSLFFSTKKQGLGYGLDKIWEKYGKGAIILASNLSSKFLNQN